MGPLVLTVFTTLSLAALAALFASPVSAHDRNIKGNLVGYQEVPSVSTEASGEFEARISQDGSSISYELTARAARLTQYEFRDRVLRAVGLQPNRTAEASRRTRIELAGLVARRAAAPVCRMEVWLQLFRIGPEGLELPGSPWRHYAGWAVRDGVITDSAWVRPPERRL